MCAGFVAGMSHRRGVVEIRMAVLETIRIHNPTKSAITGIESIPYSRVRAILSDLERNRFIKTIENHLYLTTRGKNILEKYAKVVVTLNIGKD